MPKLKLTKEQLIELIKTSDRINVYFDEKWTYPMELPVSRRDEKNNLMLHAMFQIEQRPGYVIHIATDKKQNNENQDRDFDRSA